VDEAWSVDRTAVESGLVPTMLERESPQLWIVSTAGDSSSDLLESYRQAGVAGLEHPGDTLLLEWSAEPTAAVDDRAAWQAASPHWSERRERFIARQLETLPEATFRTQILNQRVAALGGWLTRQQWSACEAVSVELDTGDRAERIIAAIEHSEDGMHYVLVRTQRQGERIAALADSVRTLDDLWRRVVNLPQSALLLVSVGFKGRLPLAPCESRPVGVNELRTATRQAHRAIIDGVVCHEPDPELAQQVLTAVVAYTGESGPVLSQRRSPGPITLARALVWCLGAQYEVEPVDQRPAPRVVSA
jgi:phage terminase large subunit-like protein